MIIINPDSIAVGNFSTVPFSKKSKTTGIPKEREIVRKMKLKIKKKNNGFSSLSKIKIRFNILKPSS